MSMLTKVIDSYLSKNLSIDLVVRVQTQWRNNRLILNAQVELFTVCWQRYCRILIREEQKKRKKENTEAIGKMTQYFLAI